MLLLSAGTASAQFDSVPPDSAFAWVPKKERWSKADERGYERFVAAIAKADCHTVETCLSAPHNPLADGDPPGLTFSADCADLVYMLRAYYAWKRGLPFGFLMSIKPRDGVGGDLRHTAGGNVPVARWDVSADRAKPDIRQVFQVIRDTVSTATFRIDPRLEHPVLQDFYSPAISRAALRPGSAIYNGDGHVVIVSQIDRDGRIHFVDAHPDGSVTRGVYAGQFQRGDPATGAGFHAWRPVAEMDGQLALAANAQIQHFSMEQYFGPDENNTNWAAADFSQDGQNHDYLEFTRRRLTKGRLRYDVVAETKLGLDGLCDAFAERQRYVEDALALGLQRLPRPGRLGGVTDEERTTWFAHSTPGRDRRLRKQAGQVGAMMERLIGLYAKGDRLVRHRKASLRRALRAAYDERSKACGVTYQNTDGDTVELSLDDVLRRLPALSFDPYHCAERRWGASGEELARCDEDGGKARWYQAQGALREVEGLAVPGNPTLEELETATKVYSGPQRQLDIRAVIETAPDTPPKRRKR